MDYEKIEKSARLRDRVRKTIAYFFLTVWGILVLFPFYWMVLSSVKSYGAYNSEWVPKLYTRYHIVKDIGVIQSILPIKR